ncbi:hypothetical protein BRADI_1g59887v3 [Brachypodium distachyon]|uniref:Uncharacterized protein n=1 Tax=Brachypodium distachyon TaxID=15368 RepID=A0A2K2DSI4_BRADI|nr:hypothetical protein BRADI_1g59887v3 [Brachypodium distachyon]
MAEWIEVGTIIYLARSRRLMRRAYRWRSEKRKTGSHKHRRPSDPRRRYAAWNEGGVGGYCLRADCIKLELGNISPGGHRRTGRGTKSPPLLLSFYFDHMLASYPSAHDYASLSMISCSRHLCLTSSPVRKGTGINLPNVRCFTFNFVQLKFFCVASDS